MKPLRDRAFEGRVNPKGIPFLYVATQEETAVAEVRPWVGAFVSVAKLTTARELRLINFTSDDHRIMLYFNEPDAPERECAVWRDIDRAFSRPVVAGDDAAGYVPTQIVAEVFRQHGFDGVAYRSSLGPGHNIAFFDLDAAAILNRSLVEIRSVKVEYE
jgi:RES domain-containing protein